ncbi:archaellin/type IV pilin N-terminal domain-containing protein [Methanoplanus limicola]|uniref:Flagellin n=1 Tax=Methanoplanus limicola DSM 2279 TaxID=937775 RepID=H1Z4D6_9EURY|nr:archaellin/type IV pilin N-terminal domain-containing protein [Methanoplanus limicola]EHQ36684.1 flagellin domain protein [Methanoplanus limicola DSM 2279]
MSKLIKSDEAFTGLEAAIVLIAFVVVAAVFSYVVLGAGFFTTQKSQEVVYSSVDMASSSMEVLGDVYGHNPDSKESISAIEFVVGLTAGGSPVDLSKTTMVFKNDRTILDLERSTMTASDAMVTKGELSSGEWGIIYMANADDSSALLENQKQFTIYAKNYKDNVNQYIGANEAFSLELKPPTGASYGIKRTAPARIKQVNLLY